MTDGSLWKWVAFFGAVMLAWPLGRLISDKPRVQAVMIWITGFLPFLGLPRVTMNPISFEHYRGDARGMEVTLIDIMMAILAFGLPPRTQPAPYRRARLLYLVVVAISMFEAPMPEYAFFGLWKVLRLYLFVVVLARAFEDWRMASRWLQGMGWGTLYALLVALQQRYLHHDYQIPSTFPHQNTLGMAMALIAPVVLAIVLAGQGGKIAWASLSVMGVLIVLGLSRGSMAAFLLGTGIVYLGSMLRGVTRTKIYAGALAVAGACLVLVKAWATIVERFVHAPKSSSEARRAFEHAASLMLHDHPFGIGINQFSWTLQHGGYAGDMFSYDRGGLVHNLYWLTLAELGYAGLIAFVLLMGTPLALAMHGALRVRRDIRGDILLGCTGGMIALLAQSTLEWLARQTVMGYLFWGIAALVYATHRQLMAERAFAAGRSAPAAMIARRAVG